jgi:hypothetical protein
MLVSLQLGKAPDEDSYGPLCAGGCTVLTNARSIGLAGALLVVAALKLFWKEHLLLSRVKSDSGYHSSATSFATWSRNQA